MKLKTIRQTVSFKAPPHRIYEMLMDSHIHARFSGGKASISRKSGGIGRQKMDAVSSSPRPVFLSRSMEAYAGDGTISIGLQ